VQRIFVESSLAESLNSASGQTVMCDADGHVIGFFSPLKSRPLLEDLQLEPPHSIAETEELRKLHRTGSPLEEILGRLGY
jgi:hypothetical protein